MQRQVTTMKDPRREKEEAWDDEIHDPEEEAPEADEETYRDGSVKNECWAEEGQG